MQNHAFLIVVRFFPTLLARCIISLITGPSDNFQTLPQNMKTPLKKNAVNYSAQAHHFSVDFFFNFPNKLLTETPFPDNFTVFRFSSTMD
jgi:hypothetical protein